jgi:hypothetical protein
VSSPLKSFRAAWRLSRVLEEAEAEAEVCGRFCSFLGFSGGTGTGAGTREARGKAVVATFAILSAIRVTLFPLSLYLTNIHTHTHTHTH